MRLISSHRIVPESKLGRTKSCDAEYHVYSLLVNFFIILNLALMPLKAYLKEEFPFVKYRSLPKLTSNSTNYKIYRHEILTQMQRHYNKHTLPKQAFYFDKERGTYISRAVVHIPQGKKVKRRSFTYGLPVCVFYPLKLNDNLVEFGAGIRNISNINDVFLYHDFSLPTVYFAVWIVPGNELNDEAGNGDPYTIYASNYRLQWSNQWKFCKLLYRLLTCSYILYQLWRKYFAHVVWLKKNLSTKSMTFKSEIDHANRYVVAIGDPTYLILSDPVVAIAFIVEIWLSLEIVAEAVVSVSQVSNFYHFFFGSFYLSRMLWFPYGGLRLLGYVLKKMKAENSFNSCDPSLVALTTTLFVGPFSGIQATSFLCEMYQYLFAVKFPSNHEIPSIESTMPLIVWTSTIVAIPIVYGFTSSKVEAVRNKNISEEEKSGTYLKQTSQEMCLRALTENNSHKNRLLLWLIGVTNHRKRICTGGSVGTLFQLDKKYNSIPTFDHRGSDCFILCYDERKLVHRLRVTCFLCIDYSKVDIIKGKEVVVHSIREPELREGDIQPLPMGCRWIA